MCSWNTFFIPHWDEKAGFRICLKACSTAHNLAMEDVYVFYMFVKDPSYYGVVPIGNCDARIGIKSHRLVGIML